MRLPIRFVLPVALLVTAGCSSGGGDGGDGDAATTATAAPGSTTVTARPASTATTASTCPLPPADGAVATVDLDGDGVDERWRPAGSGASVDILSLHRVEGCAEVDVTLDGRPAQFAVGGSVLLLQGVRCEDGIVVHLGATSEDGVVYDTLDLRYELVGPELVRVGERTGRLRQGDPELADYASFVC